MTDGLFLVLDFLEGGTYFKVMRFFISIFFMCLVRRVIFCEVLVFPDRFYESLLGVLVAGALTDSR